MELIFKGGTTFLAEDIYNNNKNLFGEFISAEMVGDKMTADYRFTLTSESGDKMIFLGGLTSGYTGTGSGGTIEVLKDAGFKFEESYIQENINFNFKK